MALILYAGLRKWVCINVSGGTPRSIPLRSGPPIAPSCCRLVARQLHGRVNRHEPSSSTDPRKGRDDHRPVLLPAVQAPAQPALRRHLLDRAPVLRAKRRLLRGEAHVHRRPLRLHARKSRRGRARTPRQRMARGHELEHGVRTPHRRAASRPEVLRKETRCRISPLAPPPDQPSRPRPAVFPPNRTSCTRESAHSPLPPALVSAPVSAPVLETRSRCLGDSAKETVRKGSRVRRGAPTPPSELSWRRCR